MRRKKIAAGVLFFPFSGQTIISMFSLTKNGNDENEKEAGRLFARHGPVLLFLFTSISCLNILDSVLTLMILDLGGVEANPIVNSAIQVFGDHFWLCKYVIVSLSSAILCYWGKRTSVKISLIFLALVYSAVVIYQINLLGHHGF